MNISPIDLSAIKKLNFGEDQFYKVVTNKKQLVLHHTASGRGIDGDFTHWLKDPKRIATCVIVGHDGTVYQLFESKYWGHHLGIEQSVFNKYGITNHNNKSLNEESIGIEIDSWGPLCFYEGKYWSYTGTAVALEEVQEYYPAFKTLPISPFFEQIKVVGKPAHFYQKYTDEQLLSVGQLLKLWTHGYDIPTTYRTDMWNVSKAALSGEPGIWTHVSYRSDKADCHPQPELIQILKSLN